MSIKTLGKKCEGGEKKCNLVLTNKENNVIIIMRGKRMEELKDKVSATLNQLVEEGIHLSVWATDAEYVELICENYKVFMRYYIELCNKYSEVIPRFAEKGQFLYNYLKEFYQAGPNENQERLVDHWVTGQYTKYFNECPTISINDKLICYKGELFTMSNRDKYNWYINDPDRYMTSDERKYHKNAEKWNMEEL